MTKKQVSQELEQIIAEEIEKALLDENIFGGLKNVAKGVASGASKAIKGTPDFVQKTARRVQDMYKKGSEEANAANRVRNSLENDLLLIASFIDASERYPAISKFIADTELGKALFSPQMHNEAYGANQLLQMMKNKKVDAPMVRDFFQKIHNNQAAEELLNQVKQMSGLEPQLVQTQQPQDQAQAQAQQLQGQPQAGEINTSGEPALSGEEAKAKIKQKLRTMTNPYFKDIFDVFAREVEAMPNIDDKTKKEVDNKLRRLKTANKRKLVQVAKTIADPAIDALEENKQLERLKKLAGILKD